MLYSGCIIYVYLFVFIKFSSAYLFGFVAAFFIAFLGSSCDPQQDPCVFQHPAEAVLGVFTMSVGDFEDITGIFGTSKYPWLVSVSSVIVPHML